MVNQNKKAASAFEAFLDAKKLHSDWVQICVKRYGEKPTKDQRAMMLAAVSTFFGNAVHTAIAGAPKDDALITFDKAARSARDTLKIHYNHSGKK